MESSRNHHHHSIHSCHLKHHQTPNSGGFERYGGFPQLSRIFPPVSSSSSTSSSTDSDIRVKRRYRFHRKWCALVSIAVIFVCLGAAAGIYFGYQFLSLSPSMEQLFRGSFTITEGDKFTENLSKHDSDLFKERAATYKTIIDNLYYQSVVKNAFLGSEILAFDGVKDGPLTVLFNVHVDTHRIRVDAGDLFITLADAVRNLNGILEGNLTLDQDSLEIQERNMEFLYLPSTERNYNIVTSNPEDTFNTSSNGTEVTRGTTLQVGVDVTVSRKMTTPSTKYTSLDSRESSSASEKSGIKKTSTGKCTPMKVDFCVNVTTAPLQNIIDESYLSNLTSIVDSQCYPFVAHFICTWGVTCKSDETELAPKPQKYIAPCRDYCNEFMANCAQHIPSSLKGKIQCGSDWKGIGSCAPKPGCVEHLYTSGQGLRICDGVMDCIDFSDELHCPYCPPGNFHCGAGKQCISPEKKCDGVTDCPNGSDEKACLTLAPSTEAAGYVHQYFNEGYLFVHDQGKLGKLCVERNDSALNKLWESESKLLLDNIGSSACELLGFRKVAFVRVQPDTEIINNSKDMVGTYVRIQQPGSSSEVTFTAGSCASKRVLYVGCNHLECGQRPSHSRKSKGWVGHGDWPWHAALLRDGVHVCDASLVTSQWLITSDQCFSGASKAKWSVHFGRVRMSSISPWQQERRVVGMVKSPLGDNLVLIKMASPVIFSDFARHVCLPEEPDGRSGMGFPSWERTPGRCVRLGWNKQEELVETPMHQLGSELCPMAPAYLSQNTSRTALCFENDSSSRDCLKELKVFPGGPIFCQNEETKEWALAGVAPAESRPKCGIEKYRISSVAGSTEWILKTIEALSNAA